MQGGLLAQYEARIAELERKLGQLVMEKDLPKKNRRSVEQPSGATSFIVSGPTESRPDEVVS